ncbi:MAG: TauD/TfdA dioxygenase family protein [Pseudomonadales bacterium]
MLDVTASGQACGASITGVDLSTPLPDETIREIRKLWLTHHVLAFPDQRLSDADLVRVTGYFGPVGDDPFFLPIDNSSPVVALTRRADEVAPVFAETWHTDWSFKTDPPIGTCLYSLTVPPVGGDTSFVNQHKVLAEMPNALRGKLEGRIALHSAALAYAPDGTYGDRDSEADRSMKIVTSEKARDVNAHPLIRQHPETGEETLYGTLGYIIGIEGMSDDEAKPLLLELYQWQIREEFQYIHKWREHMLVMWDNRSVLHRANGGYDGYARELHRITIANDPHLYLTGSS